MKAASAGFVFSMVALASAVVAAGPAYPIDTHVACADAVVEAQLVFKKPIPVGWKPGRGFPASVARDAERSARIADIGGGAVSADKVEWDAALGEMSHQRWWEAYRAKHTRILVFLRAQPGGRWRSLVLGVTGFRNDLQPSYEEDLSRTRALWAIRKVDRSIEGCHE